MTGSGASGRPAPNLSQRSLWTALLEIHLCDVRTQPAFNVGFWEVSTRTAILPKRVARVKLEPSSANLTEILGSQNGEGLDLRIVTSIVLDLIRKVDHGEWQGLASEVFQTYFNVNITPERHRLQELCRTPINAGAELQDIIQRQIRKLPPRTTLNV